MDPRHNIKHTLLLEEHHQESVSRADGGTWDWDSFYSKHRQPKEQTQAGKRMAERIERFVQSRGLELRSVADVGCGPATTLFELARHMPGTRFYGYDASKTILEMNRRKTERKGFCNLHFRYGRLPNIPVQRRYSLVLCIATIHYVRDTRRALRNLYAMVEYSGYLIFNYPNTLQRAATIREAEKDPVVNTRFRLVIEGGNLLSRQSIYDVLGRRPESFWKAVGEPPKRLNPCVAVFKQ